MSKNKERTDKQIKDEIEKADQTAANRRKRNMTNPPGYEIWLRNSEDGEFRLYKDKRQDGTRLTAGDVNKEVMLFGVKATYKWDDIIIKRVKALTVEQFLGLDGREE